MKNTTRWAVLIIACSVSQQKALTNATKETDFEEFYTGPLNMTRYPDAKTP
jgi:hypothetical protein